VNPISPFMQQSPVRLQFQLNSTVFLNTHLIVLIHISSFVLE
jgi:hypothetical protein